MDATPSAMSTRTPGPGDEQGRGSCRSLEAAAAKWAGIADALGGRLVHDAREAVGRCPPDYKACDLDRGARASFGWLIVQTVASEIAVRPWETGPESFLIWSQAVRDCRRSSPLRKAVERLLDAGWSSEARVALGQSVAGWTATELVAHVDRSSRFGQEVQWLSMESRTANRPIGKRPGANSAGRSAAVPCAVVRTRCDRLGPMRQTMIGKPTSRCKADWAPRTLSAAMNRALGLQSINSAKLVMIEHLGANATEIFFVRA